MATYLLYKDCLIRPEMNFKVDDVNRYLAGLEPERILGGQYFKHELRTSLKLNLSQKTLNFKEEANNINYISIDNDDHTTNRSRCHYFVIGKRWLSESTIEFLLYMDTLNTFVEGVNYTWSPLTLVHREHKDRFIIDGSDVYHSSKALRKIDLYSEGLNPILYKRDLGLIQTDERGLDWYLIYKNQNDPSEVLTNPVDCFLCANEEISVRGVSGGSNFSPSDLTSLKYVLLYVDNPNTTIYYSKDNQATYEAITLDQGTIGGYQVFHNVYFKTDGSTITLYKGGLMGAPSLPSTPFAGVQQIKNITHVRIVNGNAMYKYNPTIDMYTTVAAIHTGVRENLPVDPTEDIMSISSLDRTDPKIIKIIKLPYCPTFYDGTNLGQGEWAYDQTTKFVKLKDLNTKFKHFISTDEVYSPFRDLEVPLSSFVGASPLDYRFNYFESKLYHSDYHYYKFVYDSFGFKFDLERVKPDINNQTFDFEFVVTSTVNSRFLFVFTQYQLEDKGAQDYDNILSVARNNEVTIYNQQYINYLRTGYNYDVKSKQRQDAGSIIGTSLSLVGAVASFASAGVTGGLGIATGIGLLTGTVGGIVRTVNNIAQSEQNIDAKKVQLQNQATAVSGSDDVDLMSYYANNKAKLVLYEVSPKLKKALFDMFHYTGYISEENKVPNTTSRMWFNFVSCDAKFSMTKNIDASCLEDLVSKYQGGVTVLHYNSVHNRWDWDRQFENWELSLGIENQ